VATNSSRRPAGATANGDGTVVAGGAVVVAVVAVVGVGGVVGGIAVVVVAGHAVRVSMISAVAVSISTARRSQSITPRLAMLHA
jgi:hypothetical protein